MAALHPAAATPAAIIVTGPLLPNGGFSQRAMSPLFTSCSFPTFESPTAATVVDFVIQPATHEGTFTIANSCGVFSETYRTPECQSVAGRWECYHTRADGLQAYAIYGSIGGRPHVTAAVYNADLSRHWSVDGYVVGGVTVGLP